MPRSSAPNWTLPISVLLLSAVFQAAGKSLFAYESDLLSNGAYWRLITGHLVHFGWVHWLMNNGALIGIWLLYSDQFSSRIWASQFLFLCLGISAGFLLFDPDLTHYVGLSGVLHGMLAIGVTRALIGGGPAPKHWVIIDIVIASGLVLKILYEQNIGALSMTEHMAGDVIIVNAHLYGTSLGCVFGMIASAGQITRLTKRISNRCLS